MTRAELTAILTRWHTAMTECEEQMDALRALTLCAPEGPLTDSVYRLMAAYTKTTTDRIGWPDGLLQDWWLEHAFGAKPLQIHINNEPLPEITGTEELAEFIANELGVTG